MFGLSKFCLRRRKLSLLSIARLRPIFARSVHDDLKRTWYTVLGVTEKATPMEIEEAFHSHGIFNRNKFACNYTYRKNLFKKFSSKKFIKFASSQPDLV